MRTRRIIAMVLTLLMLFTMSTAALAEGETTLNQNGEAGAFTTPDTPVTQNKKLLLQKEILVFNVDANTVNAPTITYDYSIAAATLSDVTTVTDAANKHNPEGSVTATVKTGLTGATITDLVVTPAKSWNASTDGTSNYETITVDFSSVVFNGAGVYRYVVTEKLADGFTYATSGVTEGTEAKDQTTGARKRFVDVYVRPSETFTDGSKASDWDIYGYTCFYNNTSITDANKTTVPVKTTGFVSGTTDGSTNTAFTADKYYTFNLKLSKTVAGDAYGANNVAFPFTVIFTNQTITKNIDIIGDTADDPEVGTIASASRVVDIKSGEEFNYVGIPCGTSVEVYETNVATGVTYKVSTVLTAAASATTTTDASVSYGTKPASAASQTEKKAYESTAVSFSTDADQDTDISYAVDITNTFVAISPTGVILRYAPYMIMLVGGIILLLFGWKLLRRNREEE